MNNKSTVVVVVLILLVLLLGGAVYAFRHQLKAMVSPVKEEAINKVENKLTEEKTEGQNKAVEEGNAMVAPNVEIDYTAAGFSPNTVTVKKGMVVKFTNKSGSQMEVASNPHPTHTDYPGFDQWKSLFKGQDVYPFSFDKVGTWGYHNHMKPTDKGTVVVTE